MIFAPGLQFITSRLLPAVPLNAVEWPSEESAETYGRAITGREKKNSRKEPLKTRTHESLPFTKLVKLLGTKSEFRSRVLSLPASPLVHRALRTRILTTVH